MNKIFTLHGCCPDIQVEKQLGDTFYDVAHACHDAIMYCTSITKTSRNTGLSLEHSVLHMAEK